MTRFVTSMIEVLQNRLEYFTYLFIVFGLPLIVPNLFHSDPTELLISPFPFVSCSLYLLSIFYYVYAMALEHQKLRPNNGLECFNQFVLILSIWEITIYLVCGRSFLASIPLHTLLISCQLAGVLLSFCAYSDWIPHLSITESSTHTNTNVTDSSESIFWNEIKTFFLGKHLVPLVGQMDLKYFWIGRVGMQMWFLVAFRFLLITCSMNESTHIWNQPNLSSLFALFLIYLYIRDFYTNEEWYESTIDMIHDKFGFMMSWGSVVWMPFIYSYVMYDITQNQTFTPGFIPSFFWVACGCLCLYFFRLINNYRIHARSFLDGKFCNPQSLLWQPLGLLVQTNTGHKTHLVTSGPYSICRHPNYLADLGWAFCLCSLGGSWKGYLFFVFLLILLLHRCKRDEDRCFKKYGSDWRHYCSTIPYRLIPKIY